MGMCLVERRPAAISRLPANRGRWQREEQWKSRTTLTTLGAAIPLGVQPRQAYSGDGSVAESIWTVGQLEGWLHCSIGLHCTGQKGALHVGSGWARRAEGAHLEGARAIAFVHRRVEAAVQQLVAYVLPVCRRSIPPSSRCMSINASGPAA